MGVMREDMVLVRISDEVTETGDDWWGNVICEQNELGPRPQGLART